MVTEALTKVGYSGMETRKIGQCHMPALLQGVHPAQLRKQYIVNRPSLIGARKING